MKKEEEGDEEEEDLVKEEEEVPVEVGAAPDAVMAEVFLGLLRAVVLPGVRPQQVAHGPERWRLFEAVQLGKQ